LQGGIFLRVDTARKIVRDDYVLDAINSIYRLHKEKDKEDRRNEVRKVLNNAIIMTSYGNALSTEFWMSYLIKVLTM
jgi:hypothetical protein